MAYYSTHGTSQFLLNNEKQKVRFLLARPVYVYFVPLLTHLAENIAATLKSGLGH